MSRFRLPPRIAPSPAAEEPGLQNSAARLRSSRDLQSRLLAERRSGGEAGGQLRTEPAVGSVDGGEIPGKGEGEVGVGSAEPKDVPVPQTAEKVRKAKLVVLFRLPLALEPDIAALSRKDGVPQDYVVRALAHEAREVLRGLSNAGDVAAFSQDAMRFRHLAVTEKSVGQPMTTYVWPKALVAMHTSFGDPWQVTPRATVVGAYLAAIVMRLVQTRRAG